MLYILAIYSAIAAVEAWLVAREAPWAFVGLARARERIGDPLQGIGRVLYCFAFFVFGVLGAILWPVMLMVSSRGLFRPYNRFSVMRQAMRAVYMSHTDQR